MARKRTAKQNRNVATTKGNVEFMRQKVVAAPKVADNWREGSFFHTVASAAKKPIKMAQLIKVVDRKVELQTKNPDAVEMRIRYALTHGMLKKVA